MEVLRENYSLSGKSPRRHESAVRRRSATAPNREIGPERADGRVAHGYLQGISYHELGATTHPIEGSLSLEAEAVDLAILQVGADYPAARAQLQYPLQELVLPNPGLERLDGSLGIFGEPGRNTAPAIERQPGSRAGAHSTESAHHRVSGLGNGHCVPLIALSLHARRAHRSEHVRPATEHPPVVGDDARALRDADDSNALRALLVRLSRAPIARDRPAPRDAARISVSQHEIDEVAAETPARPHGKALLRQVPAIR